MKNYRIAIIALGGYDPDPQRLARAIAYFTQRGDQVLVWPDDTQKQQRFAGSEQQRLAALQTVVADPQIDIVMALRGGYGITRLLDRIDFDAVAQGVQQGKRFIGHSDFTAFELALLARTGAMSYAGPMASYDFGVDPAQQPVSAFTEKNFYAAMGEPSHAITFTTSIQRLEVSGQLWGGNLAMLCSLLGTPWWPVINHGILFLEDINEPPYRIERMLIQLHHAGVLESQQAIVLGDFSGYRLSEYDNGYDMTSMLAWLRDYITTPILTGLPFGHCRDKVTLPLGIQAQLVVDDGICHLFWDGHGAIARAQ